MKKLLICAYVCMLALAGCASNELQIPRETRVAVAAACVDEKDRPAPPVLMTLPELLALDQYRRTWALYGEWLKLRTYVAQLEAIADKCSRIPVPRLDANH